VNQRIEDAEYIYIYIYIYVYMKGNGNNQLSSLKVSLTIQADTNN
jgi:hypothetical protein